MGNLYSMSAMAKVEPNIDRSANKFIMRIKGFTQHHSAVLNMSPWLQYFAFDSIGEINFSEAIGLMDAGEDIDSICELDHEMMMYFALVSSRPPL